LHIRSEIKTTHSTIDELKKELKANLQSLINLIIRNLGISAFEFVSRSDPKLKEITDIVFKQIDSITGLGYTYKIKKELTTYGVFEIIKKVKSKEFLRQFYR